jgi:SM-20-related protein
MCELIGLEALNREIFDNRIPDLELERIADEIERQSYSVISASLPLEVVAQLRSEAQALQAQGKLSPAKVGRGEGKDLNEDQRRDSTAWWGQTPETPAQTQVWKLWSQIAHFLNRRFYFGITHFEAHWATYPAGGFYKRHVDRFQDDDARVLSAVLYLNPPDWRPEDGGEIRIWPTPEALAPLDITPEGGKLVLFLSDQIPHEVLVTHRERQSIAAWFRR